MKKELFLLIILSLPIITKASETKITDMCPALPKEISVNEPKLGDYVTVKVGDDRWHDQYKRYEKAQEKFNLEFSAELKQVESEWEKLNASLTPSQEKFYNIYVSSENDKLVSEIKSMCWFQIMGIDEMENDNLCHQLENPPTVKEWNAILICTVERMKALNIDLLK